MGYVTRLKTVGKSQGKSHLGDLDVDGRIILKLIL
jgi:hypothetical protein